MTITKHNMSRDDVDTFTSLCMGEDENSEYPKAEISFNMNYSLEIPQKYNIIPYGVNESLNNIIYTEIEIIQEPEDKEDKEDEEDEEDEKDSEENGVNKIMNKLKQYTYRVHNYTG